MSGPPVELMTREKIIFRELHQNSTTYGHVTKLFLELKFQHKGNKQTKKGQIVSKILRFSRQESIQKLKSFKCYTEKENKILDRFVIVRTGTYL